MKAKIDLILATGFGLGYSPIVSGTVGSLGGVIFLCALHYISWPLYLITLLGLVFLGIWSAQRAENFYKIKDSKYIVIDEIIGFLVGAFLVPWKWPWILLTFLIFRFFDVLKPFPLRQIESLPGGIGIVMDDLGAGIYTNVLIHLLRLSLSRVSF